MQTRNPNQNQPVIFPEDSDSGRRSRADDRSWRCCRTRSCCSCWSSTGTGFSFSSRSSCATPDNPKLKRRHKLNLVLLLSYPEDVLEAEEEDMEGQDACQFTFIGRRLKLSLSPFSSSTGVRSSRTSERFIPKCKFRSDVSISLTLILSCLTY